MNEEDLQTCIMFDITIDELYKKGDDNEKSNK